MVENEARTTINKQSINMALNDIIEYYKEDDLILIFDKSVYEYFYELFEHTYEPKLKSVIITGIFTAIISEIRMEAAELIGDVDSTTIKLCDINIINYLKDKNKENLVLSFINDYSVDITHISNLDEKLKVFT